MSLRPKQVNFQETWQQIQLIVNEVISVRPVTKNNWSDCFTYPSIMCVCTSAGVYYHNYHVHLACMSYFIMLVFYSESVNPDTWKIKTSEQPRLISDLKWYFTDLENWAP